jgi:hypothetical protein
MTMPTVTACAGMVRIDDPVTGTLWEFRPCEIEDSVLPSLAAQAPALGAAPGAIVLRATCHARGFAMAADAEDCARLAAMLRAAAHLAWQFGLPAPARRRSVRSGAGAASHDAMAMVAI